MRAFCVALVIFGVSVKCAVFNDVATVRRARCFANCLTECSRPCNVKFTTVQNCKSSCKNSQICKKSCQFLLTLKNNPKVLEGKNTITNKPGIPVEVIKNITSLTLSWKPAKASEGSVVYLLKERITGDFRGRLSEFPNLVFFQPKAVISIKQVCRFAPRFRYRWNGLKFFFTVVALTEKSSMAASKESSAIEMTRPNPVVKVAMPHFVYDPTSIGDKVRLTTTVTPSPAQADLITQYAMMWRMAFCRPIVVQRSSTSRGASRNISMFIWQRLKACNHTLRVYSLIECIPSLPTSLTYVYKGCRFVDNFNKTLCHSFDPPPTPDSARAVRNLKHSPLKITDDFRVNTTFLWLPPTFPFGPVRTFSFAYGDITKTFLGIWIATRGSTKQTSLSAVNLLPNITVRVQILPIFTNAAGVKRTILFRTPAVPQNKITARNVHADSFTFSPSTLFSVRVAWQSPIFTNGITGYEIMLMKGKKPQKSVKTTETFYVFTGILHSEPLMLEVIPQYAHAWIKPKGVVLKLKAPAPAIQDLVVRNLALHDYTVNNDDHTYAVNFTWEPPLFQKNQAVDYYQVHYHLIGHSGDHVNCPSHRGGVNRPCAPETTKTTNYLIPRVSPWQYIILSVKPVFKNSPFVQGISETLTTNPLEFSCKGKRPGYYKDSLDCSVFYHCGYHGQKDHGNCQEGLYWNDELMACDLPINVKCNGKKKSFCDGKGEGYYKDPKHCGSFYECDKHGYAYHLSCADGLYWSETKSTCDSEHDVNCKRDESWDHNSG